MRQSLRGSQLDQSWGVPWDDILPYVAMDYKISKILVDIAPTFLLCGRRLLFPSIIQHLDETQSKDGPKNAEMY